MSLMIVTRPRIDLRRTLGAVVAEWIETNLCHGPGDVQGQQWTLDDEQLSFLLQAYAIDERGRRLVRRSVYSRSKGRAKSELAAGIVCAEGLGPVRFGGWDDDGYPIGVPVTAPLCLCVATEEGQAENTYGAVHYMLKHGEISDLPGLDVGLTRTFTPGGGEIRAVSAKASSKDGGKETFVNFDETHLYVSAELHRLHATIRRNLAKRKAAQPWSLETSTMYAPGERSVAEMSHAHAKAVADGKVEDAGFLFDHREGTDPEAFDWEDDGALRDALREAYGEAAEWMDLERLIAEARDPLTVKADFIRYFLNRPARDESKRWIPAAQWAELADAGIATHPQGAAVIAAVDVAISNDSTAVVICRRLPDGRSAHTCRVWAALPEVRAHVHTRRRIDLGEVEQWIRDLAGPFDLLAVGYDPRFWEKPAQDMSDDGYTMVEIVQGSTDMRDAEQAWYAAVAGQTIVHDGDAVFADHVAATVATKTDRGWKLRKLRSEEGGYGARIDATVASIMAEALLAQFDDTAGGVDLGDDLGLDDEDPYADLLDDPYLDEGE